MASHSRVIPGSQPPCPPTTLAALSTREAAILPHILLCTKDPSRLQFDWNKLAQRMGMKNPRSAANSWLAVRKKIEAVSSAAGAESPKLTQNDQRFLANAVSCTKRPLDVDFAALASKLRMTNPRSASNAWGTIRKKISAGDSGPGIGETASMKSTVAKRKCKGNGRGSGAITRKPGLEARGDQLRLPSAEAPAAVQPFSFKVVKRESEVTPDESQSAKNEVGKLDLNSEACGISADQALSMRHIHMALAATNDAKKDSVRVKSEPFDEC